MLEVHPVQIPDFCCNSFTDNGFLSIIQRLSLPLWGVVCGDGLFAHFLFVAMDLHELLEKTAGGDADDHRDLVEPLGLHAHRPFAQVGGRQIGRASCRERV